MDNDEKISIIKSIFDKFHNDDDCDWDTIDVCIKVEDILRK